MRHDMCKIRATELQGMCQFHACWTFRRTNIVMCRSATTTCYPQLPRFSQEHTTQRC